MCVPHPNHHHHHSYNRSLELTFIILHNTELVSDYMNLFSVLKKNSLKSMKGSIFDPFEVIKQTFKRLNLCGYTVSVTFIKQEDHNGDDLLLLA